MERKNLESAAVSYPYLRGLFSIQLGIAFILAGLTNLKWGPLSHIWVFCVSVLVVGAAYVPIMRYYNDNYGRVTPPRKRQVRDAVATVIGAAVIVEASVLVHSLNLPVSGIAASFALIMLAYYAISVGLRRHHMIIWGSLLVVSLLPVWGGVGSDSRSNIGLLLIGVATIATGIFDHVALVRTLGSSKGPNLETSNVGE